MNKFRMGSKPFPKIFVRRSGQGVLKLVGFAERGEISEDGPEPSEWEALALEPEFAEAAGVLRRVM